MMSTKESQVTAKIHIHGFVFCLNVDEVVNNLGLGLNNDQAPIRKPSKPSNMLSDAEASGESAHKSRSSLLITEGLVVFGKTLGQQLAQCLAMMILS